MSKKNSTNKIALSITTSILAACCAQAYEVPLTSINTNMPPVDFHGFVSQGLLYSSQYNYLANNTKDGSLEYFEAGLNVSMNPFPHTRIAAQGFMYDLGEVGNYTPFLDYASIEYTFNDYFGVRGGRVRRPFGIYNDIQDVDLARTFVLLPQGIYDSRYRDLSCSLDGGDVFGNIPLSKAGTLSYEAYTGWMNPATDGGVAKQINNTSGGNVTSFDPLFIAGYQFWWNTPVDGLRAGAAFSSIWNFKYGFNVPTGFPPPFPTKVALNANGNILIQQYSLEYLYQQWTFQAEFYQLQSSQDTTSPVGTTHTFGTQYSWYGSAAYRFNKWFQVGGYYNFDHTSSPQVVASDAYQKDAALSFRFDPKPWWVFKVEGHYIEGTELLFDNANNPSRSGDGWFMLAVKTTVSF